jgi:Mn2+/Fe2+ NRAMP family transporter
MSEDRIAKERAMLAGLEGKPFSQRIGTYAKLCGPGWLQSAITLGGGSLASALFLGVIGGMHFLWLQPLAMIMGIIMLGAISYVTLSTGERPFRAINEHVSPVLGWSWLIATMMANMVWVLPQFNLAWGAVQRNLAPGLGDGALFPVSGGVLALAVVVVWFYDSGGKGIRLFELLLKIMVGLVVVSFFGVAVALAVKGEIKFGGLVSGLIPNIGRVFSPTPGVADAIAQTGEHRDFWSGLVVGRQRSVMIAAFATAVGINMTFLLPYSMLRKNWGREHRGLAIFDLSTGLFIPFVVATGCLVLAASSQFYASFDKGILTSETPPADYVADLERRLAAEDSALYRESYVPALERRIEDAKGAAGFAGLPKGEQDAAIVKLRAERLQQLPEADRVVAAMILPRNQFDLAKSLEPLMGPFLAQKVFGFGVLAMAVSTVIILMLINGFVLCEMFNVPDSVPVHRIGCMIVGVIGFFGPSIWGKAGAWLAVPTSLIGGALLPIAYITFLLMMNSKSLLGDALPKGASKMRWNVLMVIAAGIATVTTAFNLWYNRAPVPGLFGADVRTVAFLLAAVIVIGTLLFRGKKANV